MLDYENNISFNKIIKNLYIGNWETSKKHGDKFSMVINCSTNIPFHPNTKNKIRIPIKDTANEFQNLYNILNKNMILEQIHDSIQNNNIVLVHCHKGIQRSCSVVACYLIKYNNFTPIKAINFIKSKRSIAFYKNVHFKNTLELCYLEKIK